MNNMEVVEHEPRAGGREKCQIQVKNGYGSKSFTVYGVGIDHLYVLLFSIISRLANSKEREVKIVCYKPPQQNNQEVKEHGNSIN